MKFPDWILEEARKKKSGLRSSAAISVKSGIGEKTLRTICEEAKCPNKGECFSSGEATFLILGDTCTRNCAFCSVKKGIPARGFEKENSAIAALAKEWKLGYAVFTSPTRDDLPDGGAGAFAGLNKILKEEIPGIKTEPLIPDFAGDFNALERVLASGPDVLAHNLETAPRLYSEVRKGADYARSLSILSRSKKIRPDILTKTAVMVGLGESPDDLRKVMEDSAAAGVDIFYCGQYISPSPLNLPVRKYYSPDEFAALEESAAQYPFRAVLFGPFVRSSYKAREILKRIRP